MSLVDMLEKQRGLGKPGVLDDKYCDRSLADNVNSVYPANPWHHCHRGIIMDL